MRVGDLNLDLDILLDERYAARPLTVCLPTPSDTES